MYEYNMFMYVQYLFIHYIYLLKAIQERKESTTKEKKNKTAETKKKKNHNNNNNYNKKTKNKTEKQRFFRALKMLCACVYGFTILICGYELNEHNHEKNINEFLRIVVLYSTCVVEWQTAKK